MSIFPSVMSNTILYAGEAWVDEKLVHVLGYYNNAKNLHDGPNAMILPFPSASKMGQENVIDTSECKDVLKKYEKLFRNRTRGGASKGILLNGNDEVTIFKSGSYTVVLSDNAKQIPRALHLVEESRRPTINQEVFDKIAELYPDWPVALCCFNSTEMVEAEPMLWWYSPKDPGKLFAPALDSHDGKAPNVEAAVKVDHTVVFGSAINPSGYDASFVDSLPSNVSKYLANKVKGKKYNLYMKNGDFVLDKRELHLSSPKSIVRMAPKAA